MRLIILLLSVFFPLIGFADDAQVKKEEDFLTLPKGSVHLGDYFILEDNVEISGRVEGDLYVLAKQVFIDGHVTGDLLILAGNVDMSGVVDNNVRVLGGQIAISGTVGHNTTAVGGNVQLTSSAKLLGNLVAVAGNVDISSPVFGDATVVASNLRVSNTIKQDLEAHVGKLRLTSKAVIGGNLDYQSSATAYIDPGATIGGKVNFHPSVVHDLLKGHWIHGLLLGSKVAAILMNFLYTFVIGLIFLRLFPANLHRALKALSEQPLKAFGYGLMLLIVLPLASLILLMTILGAPFALTLIALNVIGFYTAKVFSIMWVSDSFFNWCKWKARKEFIFLIGLFIYFILTSIPIIGFIIALAAMLFGLGAGVIASARNKI